MSVVQEDERDVVAQEAMLSRANKSISVLEKAFIRNGSGRYFVLRTDDLDTEMASGGASAMRPVKERST
jgi:hypothetical protein